MHSISVGNGILSEKMSAWITPLGRDGMLVMDGLLLGMPLGTVEGTADGNWLGMSLGCDEREGN